MPKLNKKRHTAHSTSPSPWERAGVRLSFFLFLLTSAVSSLAQKADTFSVYFNLNKAELSNYASDYIDKLIFNKILMPGQKLILLGYTDYLGSNGHNDSLSDTRAKNVEDYLLHAHFDKKDITLCLGKGKIERTTINKEGYAPDRKVQIIIDRTIHAVTKTSVMDVANTKVNQTIALKNIFFVPGLSDILAISFPELEKLYQTLNDNPTLKIQIEGHICCLGPQEGNDFNELSVQRAQAVYNYLISKGIAPDRLKYIGLGTKNPIASPEITDEDRQKNRRVEIRILSK